MKKNLVYHVRLRVQFGQRVRVMTAQRRLWKEACKVAREYLDTAAGFGFITLRLGPQVQARDSDTVSGGSRKAKAK